MAKVVEQAGRPLVEPSAAGELCADPPDVDVVVVAFNGGDALATTVASILGSQKVRARVILVDNASTDGACDSPRGPRVSVVRLPQNVGYGGGFNIGLAQAQAPWVVCANQDIELHPDTLRILVDTAESYRRERGVPVVVGPRIARGDGSTSEMAHRIPSFFDELLDLALGMGRSRNAFAVSALGGHPVDCGWISAVLIVGQKTSFDRVGGFDSDYFMYVEDLDLFRRLRDAGVACVWEPRATVIHHGGVDPATRGAIPAELYALTIWNIHRYFEKHQASPGKLRGRSLLLAGAVGCLLRGMRWTARTAVGRGAGADRTAEAAHAPAIARMFLRAGGWCAVASVTGRLPARVQEHVSSLRQPSAKGLGDVEQRRRTAAQTGSAFPADPADM